MKIVKRFFRRHGDNVSARDSHERIPLIDGTTLFINIEVTYSPKSRNKISWYASVSTSDLNGNHAGDWSSNYNNSFVKPFRNLAIANKNMLAFLPYRQRQKIITKWLKKSLTQS